MIAEGEIADTVALLAQIGAPPEPAHSADAVQLPKLENSSAVAQWLGFLCWTCSEASSGAKAIMQPLS